MKNELFKKLNGSSYTNDKLKYLETKLYERSEYSSLNKYNRSPYMQSTFLSYLRNHKPTQCQKEKLQCGTRYQSQWLSLFDLFQKENWSWPHSASAQIFL